MQTIKFFILLQQQILVGRPLKTAIENAKKRSKPDAINEYGDWISKLKS